MLKFVLSNIDLKQRDNKNITNYLAKTVYFIYDTEMLLSNSSY